MTRFICRWFLVGLLDSIAGQKHPYRALNLPSVWGMEHTVQEKIDKECREGRVLGPFISPPLPNLRVSLLGVVPKKAPGEFHLIYHLSYPREESVNDAIPPDLCSVQYTSFDQECWCGHEAELAKCDIKSAFWLLPVHPKDFDSK